MIRSRRFLLLLLMILPPFAARAQQMPTDTELHAAACIPMMQWGVSVASRGLAEAEQGIAATRALPSNQQVGLDFLEWERRTAADMLEKSDSALKRLQAYLIPRLASLDPLAVLTANSRGAADVQELQGITSACTVCSQAANTKNPAKPDYSSCRANECEHKPVQDRLLSCGNPTWLPF